MPRIRTKIKKAAEHPKAQEAVDTVLHPGGAKLVAGFASGAESAVEIGPVDAIGRAAGPEDLEPEDIVLVEMVVAHGIFFGQLCPQQHGTAGNDICI